MNELLSIVGAAEEAADALALVGDGLNLTFRELGERAGRVAAALEARGLAEGELRPVATTLRVDTESVVRILGCIEAGVAFVPLHPQLAEVERVRMAGAARAAWVMPDVLEWPEPRAARRSPRRIPSERPLAILYTSGTTGRAKGAILSRRAFLASIDASRARIPLEKGDRWLLAMPPAHVGGLSIILRCLAARAAVVLGPPAGFDAGQVARIIGDQHVTHLSLVPTMLHRLLALEPGRAMSEVRSVLLGGAPANEALLEEARARGLPIQCTYGLTEACSQVATADREDLACGLRGAAPLPTVEVRVVDDEIQIRGPMLFDGYLDEDRAATFTSDGWFPTGDIGRLDENGRLYLDARRSDLILSGGENVYPAEVESALESIPGVLGACVFGVADREWGQRVAAALVVRDDDLESARRACREAAASLASFKRPRYVAVLPALRERAIGKIDRRAAIAAAESRLFPVDDDP